MDPEQCTIIPASCLDDSLIDFRPIEMNIVYDVASCINVVTNLSLCGQELDNYIRIDMSLVTMAGMLSKANLVKMQLRNVLQLNEDTWNFCIEQNGTVPYFTTIFCELLRQRIRFNRCINLIIADGDRCALPGFSRTYPFLADRSPNQSDGRGPKFINIMRIKDITRVGKEEANMSDEMKDFLDDHKI